MEILASRSSSRDAGVSSVVIIDAADDALLAGYVTQAAYPQATGSARHCTASARPHGAKSRRETLPPLTDARKSAAGQQVNLSPWFRHLL